MSFVPGSLSDISGDERFDADQRAPTSFYRRFGKRSFDLFLVLLAAPLTLPILLACAIVIRREGGPAFFWQKRVGRDGRVFRILKLRTMVEDADAKLEQYLTEHPEAQREWSFTQKLTNDPRVTKAGHFFRRTSLDELPQMWNVLRGEMSMVGPRPMTVEQVPLYCGTAYYSLRPGITGPWQVSARHKSAFAARAGHDTLYARTVSFRTDVRVLRQTVAVVLRCTGI